jgi:hypothetical protein
MPAPNAIRGAVRRSEDGEGSGKKYRRDNANTGIHSSLRYHPLIHLSIFSSPGVPLLFGFLKSPELSPRLQRLKASSLFSTLTPLELKIVDDCCTSAAIWPMKSFSMKAKKGRHCI